MLKVTYSVPLHDPQTDTMKDVLCEFEYHGTGKDLELDLVSVLTQAEVEMVDYLSETEKNKIIEYVMEKFGGEI